MSCLGDGINTLTDIATTCKLSKSTVHRLLRALEESRLSMQNQSSHRYFLGPLMTRLAANPLTTHEYLITCALSEMRRLSDIVEETVNICVMPAMQNVIIYEIPSKHDLRVTEENTRLGSWYAGGTVKVLLSQFTDEQLKIIIKRINISPATRDTITDKEALMAQVRETRRKGYAVTYGEKIPGALGMAAPILNYHCPAALSMIGPVTRIEPKAGGFLEELKASARKISGNVADIFQK
jgi:IclR family acetate operon transcriptional repressor